MADEVRLRVNDRMRTITAEPETPLLYALTDDLALQGPCFGCGLGQCGCGCGTYPRIMSAIQRAARDMAAAKRTGNSDGREEATRV